ncbi:MAG: hypothetical protein ACR2M7_06035 [Bdellovibrionales bacterium]
MNKIILGLTMMIGLASCTKESVYDVSNTTMEEAILLWESDAINNGVDPSIIDYITFEFKETQEGIAGYYAGDRIVINSIYWKGSDININTVYHEIGHALGLGHDVTPIMTFGGFASTVLRDKEEYFNLIKQQQNER